MGGGRAGGQRNALLLLPLSHRLQNTRRRTSSGVAHAAPAHAGESSVTVGGGGTVSLAADPVGVGGGQVAVRYDWRASGASAAAAAASPGVERATGAVRRAAARRRPASAVRIGVGAARGGRVRIGRARPMRPGGSERAREPAAGRPAAREEGRAVPRAREQSE